jgi:DUF4097 and DUF4098 domain-containing protein YvlB
VSAPMGWRHWMPHRGDGSIDVSIALPTGSQVRGESGVAALRSTGRVGECRYKVGVGDITLEESASLELKTGIGDITLDRSIGRTEVVTSSGATRIGRIDGAAVVKNSNGDIWIGEVTGEARTSAGNGAITIGVAHESVVAKSSKGDVRLADVARGTAVAQSAFGALEVGIHDGVAAWLDLRTRFGHVRNDLEASDSPEPGADTVEVYATTSFGDIRIHRSTKSRAGKSVS